MSANGEVTIKIKVEKDPSVTQVPEAIKTSLTQAFSQAKTAPDELNNAVSRAFSSMVAASHAASAAIVKELQGIGTSINNVNQQMASGHTALANAISQMAGVGKQSKDIDEAGKSLAEVNKEAKKLDNQINELARNASIAFGAFAVGAGAIIKGWIDAAGGMEQYRAKLETVLHSQRAASVTLEKAVDFAAKTPFDVKGIVDATTTLTIYGHNAEKVLPMVGDLAAGMSKDLSQTSLSMAKALSGSYEGFERLRNEYGITTMKLKQYGAAVDATGQLTLGSTDGLKKAKDALSKIIATDFAGAMERQNKTLQGSISNLSDEFTKLQVALGNELIPAFTATARGITKLVDAFNKSGDVAKPMIAWTAVMSAGLAGLMAPTLGVILLLKPLSEGWLLVSNSMIYQNTIATLTQSITWKGITATMADAVSKISLAGAYGTATGAVTLFNRAMIASGAALASPLGIAAAVAIALSVVTAKMVDTNKKNEEALSRAESQMKSVRNLNAYAKETPEVLSKLGVKAETVADDVKKMSDAMIDAAIKGDQKQYEHYKKLWLQGQELIEQLKVVEKKWRDITSAIKDIETEAKVFSDTGFFKNPTEELNFFKQKLVEAEAQVKKAGVVTGHEFGLIRDARDGLMKYDPGAIFNYDLSNLDKAQYKLRSLMLVKAQWDKAAKDPDAPEGQQINAKKMSEALGLQIDMGSKMVAAAKKANAEKLKDSQDYISKQKDLNQMSIAHEIEATERILRTTTLTIEQRKDLNEKWYKLKHDQEVESRNLAVTSLKHELDAVKLMTSGQAQAYDKLIKKIEEYKQAKKITEKQAYDVRKDAETGKKSAAEKEEKDQYDRMVKAQENYLKVLDKNEETSFQDKMDSLNAYERFWYEMERRRVVTTDQAETQIMKIIEKRAALEKSIIDANKKAEQDLINMRKKALDDDISRLKEKAKSGQDVEKELMNKLRDRQKEEDHALEAKQKEWTKQGVSDNKISELGSRTKAESYGKQAGELDDIIKDLQQKASTEEDRSTKMQLEGLISSLTEKRNTLSASAGQETASANAFQQAGEAEGIQEPKTGFEGAVNTFEGAVGMFSQAIASLTGGQLPGGFSLPNGAGSSQIPGVVNQAVSNQSSSASAVNNSYMLGGQGITPTADVQSKWAGLGAAIQQMQENGYLASIGGSLSY